MREGVRDPLDTGITILPLSRLSPQCPGPPTEIGFPFARDRWIVPTWTWLLSIEDHEPLMAWKLMAWLENVMEQRPADRLRYFVQSRVRRASRNSFIGCPLMIPCDSTLYKLSLTTVKTTLMRPPNSGIVGATSGQSAVKVYVFPDFLTEESLQPRFCNMS